MRFKFSALLGVSIIPVLLSASFPAAAVNEQRTLRSTISELEAGWAADTYSVKLSTAPLINPAGCPVWNAGYVTSTTDPGRKLYQDLLRDAFYRNYSVELLISGTANDCPFGKPRIVSVLVRRP